MATTSRPASGEPCPAYGNTDGIHLAGTQVRSSRSSPSTSRGGGAASAPVRSPAQVPARRRSPSGMVRHVRAASTPRQRRFNRIGLPGEVARHGSNSPTSAGSPSSGSVRRHCKPATRTPASSARTHPLMTCASSACATFLPQLGGASPRMPRGWRLRLCWPRSRGGDYPPAVGTHPGHIDSADGATKGRADRRERRRSARTGRTAERASPDRVPRCSVIPNADPSSGVASRLDDLR